MEVKNQSWFERIFPTGLLPPVLPEIMERLRGTPARLEERVRGQSPTVLTRRLGQTWSIQETGRGWRSLGPPLDSSIPRGRPSSGADGLTLATSN
jgi:hypothetical protein